MALPLPAQHPWDRAAGCECAESIHFPPLAKIHSFNHALLGAEVSCAIVFLLLKRSILAPRGYCNAVFKSRASLPITAPCHHRSLPGGKAMLFFWDASPAKDTQQSHCFRCTPRSAKSVACSDGWDEIENKRPESF